jgi:hypothetical protein
MVYLLRKSPLKVAHAGHFGGLAMILAAVVYWIIGTASKGTQIWNLVVQNSGNTDSASKGDKTTNNIIKKSLQIFQDLDTVASGMLFLFAIGFAILASRYLNHKSKTKTLRKRLTFAVAVLAAAFLVRNAVKFTFALIYSQFSKFASLSIQLVYMAIYGLLSVIIFACIIASAAIQGDEATAAPARNGQVVQTANSEPEGILYYHQAKSMTQSYNPYRY